MDKRKLLTLMGGSNDPYPGVYVYDKFTDTNSVGLDAHIPDKPKSARWEEIVGTWDIQSNLANVATVSGYGLAVIESGKANCTISVIAKSIINANNCYIAFRYVDNNNYLMFYIQNTRNAASFGQKVGGTLSAVFVGDVDTTPIVTGSDYLLKVVLLGNTVKFYVDGILKIDTTNNNLLTATKHGILSDAALQKFDDFQVT
jgi:hypothetical protein